MDFIFNNIYGLVIIYITTPYHTYNSQDCIFKIYVDTMSCYRDILKIIISILAILTLFVIGVILLLCDDKIDCGDINYETRNRFIVAGIWLTVSSGTIIVYGCLWLFIAG